MGWVGGWCPPLRVERGLILHGPTRSYDMSDRQNYSTQRRTATFRVYPGILQGIPYFGRCQPLCTASVDLFAFRSDGFIQRFAFRPAFYGRKCMWPDIEPYIAAAVFSQTPVVLDMIRQPIAVCIIYV